MRTFLFVLGSALLFALLGSLLIPLVSAENPSADSRQLGQILGLPLLFAGAVVGYVVARSTRKRG